MSSPSITFHFQNSLISLPSRKDLKLFIGTIFKKEGKKFADLSIIFCSDKYLLKINQKFLSHDYYTDIITFNLSENEEIVAEIYISSDRIRENARTLKISITNEILRVIFHGILHLCGYDDNTKKNKEILTSKEDYYINQWNNVRHFT